MKLEIKVIWLLLALQLAAGELFYTTERDQVLPPVTETSGTNSNSGTNTGSNPASSSGTGTAPVNPVSGTGSTSKPVLTAGIDSVDGTITSDGIISSDGTSTANGTSTSNGTSSDGTLTSVGTLTSDGTLESNNCCPTGQRNCHPCDKKVPPVFYYLKTYNGDHRPAYFAYKAKDRTYRKEIIYFTKYGPKVHGSFRYKDKCSGIRVDESYIAGKNGYQPTAIILTDDSALDIQLPVFDLNLVSAEEQLITTTETP